MVALTYAEAVALARELLEEPHGSEEKDVRLARRMGWTRVEEPASRQGGSVARWQPPEHDEPFGLTGTRNVARVLGWLTHHSWQVILAPGHVVIPGVARLHFPVCREVRPRFHPLALPLAVCALFTLAPPTGFTQAVDDIPHGRRLLVGPYA